MRRCMVLLLGTAALLAISAVGIATAAGAEEPEAATTAEEPPMFSATFTPQALSRTTYTPIHASLSERVHSLGHPPAERSLLIEIDRHLRLQTRGLPACHPQIQIQASLNPIQKECARAKIGWGRAGVQVQFAEEKAIEVPGKLIVFNGGERHGRIRMWVRGSFGPPINGALLTEVTFRPIDRGHFGWLAEARIPQITGGSGSITRFHLTIGRNYLYKGRRRSVLSARCPNAKLRLHVDVGFENGTEREEEVTSPCRVSRHR